MLRPLVADDLPLMRAWFEDGETRRWLGGPDWPGQALALCNANRHALAIMAGNAPGGLIDLERYPDDTASFAIAVDPRLRRQGVARRAIEALLRHPLLDGSHAVFAGVETGNTASAALLRSTGFAARGAVDADGFLYYWRNLP